MASQSEITARLNGDNSNFRSAMNQSVRIAGETGQRLTKNLDLRDAAKTMAVAVGANIQDISENVARFIIGMSKQAEKAFADIGSLAESNAAKNIQLMEMRLTEAQKIARSLARIADGERSILTIQEKQSQELSWWQKALVLTGNSLGPIGQKFATQVVLNKQTTEEAEKQVTIQKIQSDVLDEKLKIAAKQKDNDATRTKDLTKQAALLASEVPNVEKTLDLEKGITAELQAQLEAMHERDQLAGKMRLATEDTLIVGNKAYGASRNPEQLANASDKELQELIRRAKQNIAEIEAAKNSQLNAASAASGFYVASAAIDRQKTDIQRANYQLNLRDTTRRLNIYGGEDVARKNYEGDPLQFDAFFQQYTQAQEKIDTTNRLLQRLVDQQTNGVAVINVGE